MIAKLLSGLLARTFGSCRSRLLTWVRPLGRDSSWVLAAPRSRRCPTPFANSEPCLPPVERLDPKRTFRNLGWRERCQPPLHTRFYRFRVRTQANGDALVSATEAFLA